jgi:hypothetical protein
MSQKGFYAQENRAPNKFPETIFTTFVIKKFSIYFGGSVAEDSDGTEASTSSRQPDTLQRDHKVPYCK